MNGPWIKWTDRRPPATKRCDFLYNGDGFESNVWMMCNTTDRVRRRETCIEEPTYWRPAEKLPQGIKRYPLS